MKPPRLSLSSRLLVSASALAAAGVEAVGATTFQEGRRGAASDIIRWQAPPESIASGEAAAGDARLGFSSGYIFHEQEWADGYNGMAAGLSYQLAPALSVSFGGYLREGEDGRGAAMPMLFLDWRIDDHWTVRTANGLRLSYDVSADRRHLLSADVAWETEELSYGAPWAGGGWPFVAGDEPALRASLAWQWNLGHHFAVRPEVSYRFARSVELRGRGGAHPEHESTGAFAVGATVSARF